MLQCGAHVSQAEWPYFWCYTVWDCFNKFLIHSNRNESYLTNEISIVNISTMHSKQVLNHSDGTVTFSVLSLLSLEGLLIAYSLPSWSLWELEPVNKITATLHLCFSFREIIFFAAVVAFWGTKHKQKTTKCH